MGFEPGYLQLMIRDGIHSATQDNNLDNITITNFEKYTASLKDT